VQFEAPRGYNTDSDPSARDVAALIRLVREQHIKALFVENMTNPNLVEEIARDSGAVVGPSFTAMPCPGRRPGRQLRGHDAPQCDGAGRRHAEELGYVPSRRLSRHSWERATAREVTSALKWRIMTLSATGVARSQQRPSYTGKNGSPALRRAPAVC